MMSLRGWSRCRQGGALCFQWDEPKEAVGFETPELVKEEKELPNGKSMRLRAVAVCL